MDDTTNYVTAIDSAFIATNKSTKTGNTYHTFNLTFTNGYSQRFFLDDAQVFAIKSSMSEINN